MDRIIEKLDRGWWVVSHEQKLWLPGGELPHGEAVNFDLVGQHALHIGEWQGESVWMVVTPLFYCDCYVTASPLETLGVDFSVLVKRYGLVGIACNQKKRYAAFCEVFVIVHRIVLKAVGGFHIPFG